MRELAALLAVLLWLAGIKLAATVWATFFAILFAPLAWYFVVERVLVLLGAA